MLRQDSLWILSLFYYPLSNTQLFKIEVANTSLTPSISAFVWLWKSKLLPDQVMTHHIFRVTSQKCILPLVHGLFDRNVRIFSFQKTSTIYSTDGWEEAWTRLLSHCFGSRQSGFLLWSSFICKSPSNFLNVVLEASEWRRRPLTYL